MADEIVDDEDARPELRAPASAGQPAEDGFDRVADARQVRRRAQVHQRDEPPMGAQPLAVGMQSRRLSRQRPDDSALRNFGAGFDDVGSTGFYVQEIDQRPIPDQRLVGAQQQFDATRRFSGHAPRIVARARDMVRSGHRRLSDAGERTFATRYARESLAAYLDRSRSKGGHDASEDREATEIHGRRARPKARRQEDENRDEREGAREVREQRQEEELISRSRGGYQPDSYKSLAACVACPPNGVL